MGFLVISALFVVFLNVAMYILLRSFMGLQGKRIHRGCLILNLLSIIGIGMGFKPENAGELTAIIIQSVTIWLMTQIFLIVLLSVALVAKLLFSWLAKSKKRDIFSGMKSGSCVVAVMTAVALSLSLYGSFVGRHALHTVEYTVPVEGLGERLEGYRIAQISDVHLGSFYSLDDFQQLLERTAAEQPDVLVVTGDVFDNAGMTMQAARLLDSYSDRFPQGIYYCRGNHEHIRGIPLLEIALEGKGIHNLVNDNAMVLEDSRPLYIAGVDYPMQRDQFDYLADAYTKKAMDGIPANAVKVLLAHHPDFVKNAAGYDTELVLSGHTHGGQLGFDGIPLVPPVFEYLRGWYSQGDTRLYVHPGNGSWFPFRLGCQPEIAVFKLIKAE
ncbi:MAG: metallophosphoesterase [Anaerovibrio sp.]